MGIEIGIFVPNGHDARGPKLAQLINAVMPTARCTYINLRTQIPGFWVQKKNTKATYEPTNAARPKVAEKLERLCEGKKYDAFICIDVALAHYVLPENDAKAADTDKLAGMIVEIANGKPLLFHFDPLHVYGRQHDAEHQAGRTLMSAFMLRKLSNRLQGMAPNEKPIKFILPQSIADLRACKAIAEKSELIAFDIETSGGLISCIGFACEVAGPYNPVFVVPLYVNIDGCRGNYWDNEHTLAAALDAVAEILDNDVPKVAHNGGYDLSIMLRYGWHVNNFIFDTMLMMHATWPTLPRSLFVGASMFLSQYRFWKDDAKEVGDDGKVKWRTPREAGATWNYWHYNALDCVNTLELCLAILRFWTGTDEGRYPRDQARNYMWLTYVRKFALEFGPCFYMSNVGIEASTRRQAALRRMLEQEAEEAKYDLQNLVGDDNFNPNSPPQVAFLLYDILDIRPLARQGRTTDKRILQKFADMHPIYNSVISAVWAAKEPANNASKYGRLPLMGDRYMLAQFKAAVTTTARLSSAQHNREVGTNLQNMPKPMRVFCHAGHDEYLVSSDYSQSDSYFVAFESQDATMIETVLDDRDTHSVHVEFFFGHKYEDVVKGSSEKAAWVVHPVTGVRQIIKKVSHGTNYDMGGATMLLNIRREAAVSMVNAILMSPNGAKFIKYMGLDASKGASFYAGQGALWSDQQLAKACDFAQALYYLRYKKLAQWKREAVQLAHINWGVIHMFGGSATRMLAAPSLNPRFVPAAYGQGGTAGNINNAMLRLYYLAEDMWQAGFKMRMQVHDELLCTIPRTRLDLVQRKVDIMQAECKIHGRKFVVPVEAELSISWDPKNTVVWKGAKALDYHAKIDEAEAKTLKKLGLTQEQISAAPNVLADFL